MGAVGVFHLRVISRHLGFVADGENWGENAMRECPRGWRAGKEK